MSHRTYTAEAVFPGHPDKLCDTIADALVAEAARRQGPAAAGIEVAVDSTFVYLSGHIACHDAEGIDVESVVRSVFREAAYGNDWPPDPDELQIHCDLVLGPLETETLQGVADDQCVVTGFAVDLPTTNYLPPEHWLAHRLCRRCEKMRVEIPELRLGPDGKVLVGLQEEGVGAWRLAWFSASLQQSTDGDHVELRRAIQELIEEQLREVSDLLTGFDPTVPEQIRVNGYGNFDVGGPLGDNGLSGKKLVIDAYGPRVPVGGGALCGKDFYRVDRAGAIIARRLAKAVVLTGAASQCTATLAVAPGDHKARLVSLVNADNHELDAERWQRLLDLSIAGAGDRFSKSPDLPGVARYGHFTDATYPWELLAFDEETEADSEIASTGPEEVIACRH